MPGQWDIINLDGTLSTVNNKSKDINICSDSYTRLAYIKSGKDSHRDNRTYKQVDSMEAYIRYKLLSNPSLLLCDISIFTKYEMGFSLDNLAKEIGIPKKNLMYQYDESK